MGKVIQMRDFPEDLHHRAKVQAAKEGITLEALIIRLLQEYLDRKGGG